MGAFVLIRPAQTFYERIKINHLHFKTPDPQKTAQWYVKHLGATIVSEIGGASGTLGYRMDLHGVPMNVTGFVDGQKLEQFYGLEHVALDTDDLPGVVESLKADGRAILEERALQDGRKVCFFDGPEGVRLEVIELAN